MQLFGDVSEKHKEMAQKLANMEASVLVNKEMPTEKKAQCLVCLAHDWYQLGMEEEGRRLLFDAERICNGYYTTYLSEHLKENQEFSILIRSLLSELVWVEASEEENKGRN